MPFLLRVAVALALLFAPTANANLTPYTATYDATIVYVKSSLADIAGVVTAQNNAWLRDQFTTLNQDVDAAIVNGQLSYAKYMELVRAFYATADTKVPTFTEITSARLENSAIDFAQYNAAAPASWCDFVFATFTGLAEAANRKSLRELVAATHTEVEKQIETKGSASTINERMKAFYQQANTFDGSVVASFDAKVAAFLDATVVDRSPDGSAKGSQDTTTPAKSQTSSGASGSTKLPIMPVLVVFTALLVVVV